MGIAELITDNPVAFFAITLLVAFLLNSLLKSSKARNEAATPEATEEPEEPEPPKDFTPAQLRKFNGVPDPDAKAFDPIGSKIYVALKGEVFDVTAGANFYGPDGPYHMFAGRDASRCLAKMCFDEEALENPSLEDCNTLELEQVDEWVNKYKYMKNYPVVGRLSMPPARRQMTVEEIAPFNGAGELPEGRVNPPIYLAVNNKVFDVSFGGISGGFEMYKPGATYNLFAGKDASRALAKMSFDAEHVNSRDLSGLSDDERKVLADWEARFENRNCYPIVGDLEPWQPEGS